MKKRMPSTDELRRRYEQVEQNQSVERNANWVLPNTAKPFGEDEEERFLQHMESTADSYDTLLGKTLESLSNQEPED